MALLPENGTAGNCEGRRQVLQFRTQPTMDSINPATERVMGRYPLTSPSQIDHILDEVQQAYRSWGRLSVADRAVPMRDAASYLRANNGRLAGLITAEMGKPIAQSEAEIEKCAWACEFYADNAGGFLEPIHRDSSARESYIRFDPLGAILAVMPWNFPFWQLFRVAAPTLMAGNTVLLKHASNVPQCALAIEELFLQSGFPRGVFRTLLVPGSKVEGLIADPRVAGVSITGSEGAGRQVAAAAGGALKKSVLELGGSDPFIVLEDADLDKAARAAAWGRNQNSGQSCIASKRFLVHHKVAGEFLDRFAAEVLAMKVGDPADRSVRVGPLARRDLVEALERQVKASVAEGARVVVAGRQPRPGFYYTPSILDGVGPEMVAFREETFGPVAAVTRVKDSEEAIEMANLSSYGLGASIWTRDLDRAREMAPRIEAGSVFVNGIVASDPRLPFGGVKNSGYGRELSEFGIREFTNVKTVWIGEAGAGEPEQRQGPARRS